MNDDAGRPLPFAHLVDGLRHFVEADFLPMLGDGSSRPSATASSVPYQSWGSGPPPNWIVMPLCVASVQSIVPASYQPPATCTRAMNSHESTMVCNRPCLPTHSKMTCVIETCWREMSPARRHTDRETTD